MPPSTHEFALEDIESASGPECNNINEAKEFFKNDLFASSNGIELDELSEKECLCSMTLNKNHLNAYGASLATNFLRLSNQGCRDSRQPCVYDKSLSNSGCLSIRLL